jgi:hypothetical protein
LTRLDRNVLERLAKARETALEAHRESVPAREWVFSTEVPGVVRGAAPRTGYLLATLLLLASLALAFSWQNAPDVSDSGPDVADVDAGLLSGELPLQAYLDNDLDRWLDSSSAQP